jgi:hypothetical protein
MAAYEAGIFQNIDAKITEVLSRFGATLMTNRVTQLTSMLSAAIGLYILYKGYMVFSGKTQKSFYDRGIKIQQTCLLFLSPL